MTSNKNILIVGGLGDTGRALCTTFANLGWRIAVLHRSGSEDEVTKFAQSLPTEAFFIQCDTTQEKATEEAVEEAANKLGSIDVAIYAAADPILRKRLGEMNTQEFRSSFEATLFGAFTFFTSTAKVMRAVGTGTLIGITSTAIESDTTVARMSAYTVAKIALRGFLRELHRELGPSGIRVFAVAPYFMRTKLNADLPEKFFEIAEAQGGMFMTPQEVADACVSLLKSDSQGGTSLDIRTQKISAL